MRSSGLEKRKEKSPSLAEQRRGGQKKEAVITSLFGEKREQVQCPR